MGFLRSCQRNKTRTEKPLGLLQSLPIPEARFVCVGLDWFSLPKDEAGFDSVLIVVDYFTKLTVLIPVKSIFRSQESALLFKENWIDRGFGIPTTIISDRDSKLVSESSYS